MRPTMGAFHAWVQLGSMWKHEPDLGGQVVEMGLEGFQRRYVSVSMLHFSSCAQSVSKYNNFQDFFSRAHTRREELLKVS